MPTYDYLCSSCGNRFERFQSINDAPLESCPSCGGPVKRLISAAGGFILKKTTGARTPCGNDVPCCGRDVPCGKTGNCG